MSKWNITAAYKYFTISLVFVELWVYKLSVTTQAFTVHNCDMNTSVT